MAGNALSYSNVNFANTPNSMSYLGGFKSFNPSSSNMVGFGSNFGSGSSSGFGPKVSNSLSNFGDSGMNFGEKLKLKELGLQEQFLNQQQSMLDFNKSSLGSQNLWSGISAGASILGSLGNLYMQHKQMKLARDQFNFQKEMKQREIQRQNQMDTNLSNSVNAVYGAQ